MTMLTLVPLDYNILEGMSGSWKTNFVQKILEMSGNRGKKVLRKKVLVKKKIEKILNAWKQNKF